MRRVNNSGRCKFILHYAVVSYEIKIISAFVDVHLKKILPEIISQAYCSSAIGELLVKYRCELGNVVAVEHLWDYCSKAKASVPRASDKLGE